MLENFNKFLLPLHNPEDFPPTLQEPGDGELQSSLSLMEKA